VRAGQVAGVEGGQAAAQEREGAEDGEDVARRDQPQVLGGELARPRDIPLQAGDFGQVP
jgi:hypothetical protein